MFSQARRSLRGALSRNGRLRKTFRERKAAIKALGLLRRAQLKRLWLAANSLVRGESAKTESTALVHLPVVLINLDRRPDRLEESLGQFLKLGLPKISRFSAIETQDGLVGCAESHLAVLNNFISSGAPVVMVCEDDISFSAEGDCFAQTVQDFLSDSVLDVLCVGNNQQRAPLPWSDSLSLTSDTQTTSCYVVKQRAAKALARNLRRGVSLLSRTGKISRYALDIYWKRLQGGRLVFCVPTKRLALQRPSFSDIQNGWVDYGA